MSKEVTYEPKDDKFIKISSTGNIDLEITLSLTEKEAENFRVFPDKIDSIADCEEFLKPLNQEMQQMTFKTDQFKKSNIYDYIKLTSNNSTISSLLVINRAFKKKAFIEFITLSELKFKPENSFLKEFVRNISEQNFLFLVENNFLPNMDSKIKFVIKIENKIVKIFENICLCNEQPEASILKPENSRLLYNLENSKEEKKSKNTKSVHKSLKSANKLTDKSTSKISAKSRVSILNQSNLSNNKSEIKDGSNNKSDKANEEYSHSNINEGQNNSEINSHLEKQKNDYQENEGDSNNIVNKTQNELNNQANDNDNNNLDIEPIEKEEVQNSLNRELGEEKIINDAENKSNLNELDETANKILNSIPNVNASNNHISNQSKISNNADLSNHLSLEKNQIDEVAEKDSQIGDAENKEKSNLSIKNNEEGENQEFKNDRDNFQNDQDKDKNEGELLSVFERFKYDFNGSDYFFVDMNEMLELKRHKFSILDFYSLLKKITDDFKNISIIINYPNIINNIGYLDLESINTLNEVLALTDIYIFDKTDALALFNLMSQINSEDDNYEDKKNLEQLFIKEIKKKRKSHPKIGIFLDELKRVTIIEQQSTSNLILFHTDYQFDLIPANVSKVISEDYKKLFVVHYEMLKSVFIGGFFSRMLYKKPFNSAFTAGNESLKRVIELLRFNLDSPLDPNFFLIRIIKKEKLPDEEQKLKKKKEQHFTLDSTNIISSKMREYNPLYDDNLVSYFSSKYIRKHLKKLGFINKKGQILQDPDNKKLGIIESKKLNRVYEEEKSNLEKIKDKKEKLKLQIRNLLQGNSVMKSGNMKEIEKLAKVYNFRPEAEKKLPSVDQFKKSISKNIKLNSEMYLKEIQKGKSIRSKSQQKSPLRISASNKKIDSALLEVMEKIEDKILYDQTSKISENRKNSNNSLVHKKELSHSNLNKSSSHHNSNINVNISIRENYSNNNSNINYNSMSGNNSKSHKTKSGKSQMSPNKSKLLENSNIKNSYSMNRNLLESSLARENDEKSGDNLLSGNKENIFYSKILKDEVGENDLNLNLNNNDLDIKKEFEGTEEEQNNSNVKLNLEPNENIDVDNKSFKDNNMNNLSKISKKVDISANDINMSSKKSNLAVDDIVNNNNNIKNVENEDNLEDENEKNVNNKEEGKVEEN